MLAESRPRDDSARFRGAPRHLTEAEAAFLCHLFRHCKSGNEFIFALQDLVVRDMHDGGMGSLYFPSEEDDHRKLGKALVEAEFLDEDDMLVSAVVNLDAAGQLYELDMLKMDCTPLLRLPRAEDVTIKRC